MLNTVRHFLTAAGVFAASFMSAQTITHTISDVQGELFASPLIEQVVTVQGVITAASDYSYFIQDGSSAVKAHIEYTPAVKAHMEYKMNRTQ